MSVVGSSVNGVALPRLCRELGFDERHLTSKRPASSALPVLLAQWPGAQLINQAFSQRARVPIVSYGAGRRDARLAQWRADLFEAVCLCSHGALIDFPLEAALVVGARTCVCPVDDFLA